MKEEVQIKIINAELPEIGINGDNKTNLEDFCRPECSVDECCPWDFCPED